MYTCNIILYINCTSTKYFFKIESKTKKGKYTETHIVAPLKVMCVSFSGCLTYVLFLFKFQQSCYFLVGWEDPLEKERATHQYSRLGNPVNIGVWWATVLGIVEICQAVFLGPPLWLSW